MSNVIIYDPNESRQQWNTRLLQEQGHEVVTSSGLQEALDKTTSYECQLLVLGFDAMRAEDRGLWPQVRNLADTAPVIALHNRPSQETYEIAARLRIAAILPNSVSREIFAYAVEQAIRRQPGNEELNSSRNPEKKI